MNYITPHNPGNHETKFVFNNTNSHLIVEWLSCSCQPDPEFPAGIVSSIYYDTRDWQFLREKINSDYLKTKVRVRWYSDINKNEPSEYSYIEVKQKVGAIRKKIRIKTDIPGRWLSQVDLHNEKLLQIPSYLRMKGVNIPMHIHPVFQISYKRWRFVELMTGTRLCVDCDISTPRVNELLVPNPSPFYLRQGVFELKGSIKVLPDVLHQLTDMGCRKESFSKYSNCYNLLKELYFHI
jgi:hypothetical protein